MISGRDFDRSAAYFRAMYDVEISENTANVKQNASLPARASLSCFKALTFSYFNI